MVERTEDSHLFAIHQRALHGLPVGVAIARPRVGPLVSELLESPAFDSPTPWSGRPDSVWTILRVMHSLTKGETGQEGL